MYFVSKLLIHHVLTMHMFMYPNCILYICSCTSVADRELLQGGLQKVTNARGACENFGARPLSFVTRPLVCRELANLAVAVNVC